MTNLLIGLIPGLVSAFVVWLAFRGIRHYRSNALEDVPWQELVGAPPPPAARASDGPLMRLGRKFSPLLRESLPRPVAPWLQRQVDLAGRPDGLDVDTVLARVLMWLIIVTPLVVLEISQGQPAIAALAVVAAIFVPLGSLIGKARSRRDRIDQDLPDFMDVVAVTVSAGIGFRQALGIVAQRFGGPLSEEMQTTLYQIDNGASVRSAFTSLRTRVDSESVTEFVSAYLQAEELGAPLVQTLNQIADDLRRAGAQRRRQQAAKVAPRVTLVTTIVMVPAAIILILVGMLVGGGMLDQLGTLVDLGG